MLRIAHVIHPGEVPKTSDLAIAQPITFASMSAARDHAAGKVDVALYAVKYRDESPVVPDGFGRLPELERSAKDLRKTREH
jgi:hypothetical protein